MSEFILTTESPADLSKEYFEQTGIPYIPYHFQVNDDELLTDWVGVGMTPAELSELMDQGVVPKTSQPNTAEYEEFFEPYLQAGWDIFHVVFSSGLSGAYNACVAAVEELREKYPERKIIAVDSRAAAPGFGLMVDEVYTRKQNGATMEELEEFVIHNRDHLQHWFYVTDLKYLKNGGRISRTTAILGTLINVKPVLCTDDEGHLIPLLNVRGRKKALATLVDKMAETVGDYQNDHVFISHCDSIEDAQTVGRLVTERFGIRDIMYGEIGTTIGAHSGPGTIALFYFGRSRK